MSSDEIDIIVRIDGKELITLHLNPSATLSNIRKELDNGSLIQMNDKLFAKKINSKMARIARKDEERRKLNEIIEEKEEEGEKLKYLHLIHLDEEVNVYMNSQKFGLFRLNLNNKLSEIRQILEMDETSIFDTETAIENENMKELRNIIKKTKEGNILYLRRDSEAIYRFLSGTHKLCYGINDKFEEAEEPAFEIKSYNMNKINDYQEDIIEIDQEEALTIKKCWHLTADIEQDFGRLGISIGSSKTKNSDKAVKTNLIRKVIECKKMSLTFKLVPTDKFIREVTEAIKDFENSRSFSSFQKVTDKFGKFISKKVIFGGKVYFGDFMNEIANEDSKGAGESESGSKKKFIFKPFGGKMFSSKNFDESQWIKSLDDFKMWACIKISDPISIFEPLSDDLRKKILGLAGKIIHYSDIEVIPPYNLDKSEPEKPKEFDLKIPDYILKFLNNDEADCSIFATITDTQEVKKDFFNCQILWEKDQKPKLIIHCIQEKFKKRECNLNIKWMVFGNNINFNFNTPYSKYQLKVAKYDFNEPDRQFTSLDLKCDSTSLCFGIPVLRNLNDSNILAIGHYFFNEENKTKSYLFSYSLKEKHYTNLPQFTFHTLIIPHYLKDKDNHELFTFKTGDIFAKNYTRISESSNPLKYISLYSTSKDNLCPIFLRQRGKEIRIKHIRNNCEKDNCICKKKLLKDNFKYRFFDSKTQE